MATQKHTATLAGLVSCPAQAGVEVNVDYRHRMMWIAATRIKLQIALGLDELKEFGYNVQDRTLSIVLRGALQYVEIPCSQRQAENILTKAGWDSSRLLINSQ
ncbi:hypothetical protein PQR46_20595 [Paraburkholderia sediminicola]|uniref:hypothetical protein n=1 Tax=Paraburkholderia sediminicola TaxID=458836 RepID=UPI0038BCFA18